MRTQKVIVSNTQNQIIICFIDVVKVVDLLVGGFINMVQPFNHLLEWTEFFGNSIVVGKFNNLCNVKFKSITELMKKLLNSKGIGTILIIPFGSSLSARRPPALSIYNI